MFHEFCTIADNESFEKVLHAYEFIFPNLWLEHVTFHVVMENSYIFLLKHLEKDAKEMFTFIKNLEDKGKLLEWSTKRLRNSNCKCSVCEW